MRGSGLATPTTWLSTITRIETCAPITRPGTRRSATAPLRSDRWRSTPHPSARPLERELGQRRDALRNRPSPEERVAGASAAPWPPRPTSRFGHADAAHVRVVVLVPERLAAAGRGLRRHAGVVRSTVRLHRRVAAVVRQQRAEHRGIRKHQHSPGIEQDRLESCCHSTIMPVSRSAPADTYPCVRA